MLRPPARRCRTRPPPAFWGEWVKEAPFGGTGLWTPRPLNVYCVSIGFFFIFSFLLYLLQGRSQTKRATRSKSPTALSITGTRRAARSLNFVCQEKLLNFLFIGAVANVPCFLLTGSSTIEPVAGINSQGASLFEILR
ncbi:hypothetical protein LSM04_009328 [Trypanosoma melophagium]|uniref:uncharacterized protein n=1 Tax=Trypanosoma melophagium TaxID=715481 RepID=UPI003519FAD1|nr:hypothetical protein LSM04_009328 [Trypanosoma melophagium]